MPTVDQRYGQTYGHRTDGRTTYDSNTALALRASRGKNEHRIPDDTQRQEQTKHLQLKIIAYRLL